MESTSLHFKPFFCPIHPTEEIQRVSLDLCSETSLQCIECILNTKGKVSPDKFCPITDFVNYIIQQSNEANLSFCESPPNHLVDFLDDEEAKTKALAQHIEEEKQKVQENFNSLLQEFTLLCHNKKEEILRNLDTQLLLLKKNYDTYKINIHKYYTDKKENFDKDSFIKRIDSCKDTSELEILVQNIKEDILQAMNDLDDSESKEEKIKESLKNFAQELHRQSNTTPTCSLNDSAIFQNSLEKIKGLLGKFTEINNPIIDLFGKELSLNSNIVTKTQDSALIRKWLSMSGFTTRTRLIYRGSRDGFDPSTFHAKCDDFEPTLTIVKSTSGHIFGGFSSRSWKATSEFKASFNCWLFSINHREQYHLKKDQCTQAIYTDSLCGPYFGGGPDLYINLRSHGADSFSNLGLSYECDFSEPQSRLTGKSRFDTEEIEIFAVLRK